MGENQYVNEFFCKIYNELSKDFYDSEMVKSYFNFNLVNTVNIADDGYS